jgi:succinate dehydrogenase/fumarate reductase flavoprotein subunit
MARTKTATLRLDMQRAMQENCAVFRTQDILDEGVKLINDVYQGARRHPSPTAR